MRRYTTPTITLIVENIILTNEDIYVSLEQNNVGLDKSGSDLTISDDGTDTTIIFILTQEETARFKISQAVSVQVNWITPNGFRAATEIKTIPVMRNLLEEVIAYGN